MLSYAVLGYSALETVDEVVLMAKPFLCYSLLPVLCLLKAIEALPVIIWARTFPFGSRHNLNE